MAVLPWGHTRTQTNSSAEKPKASTLDWFSRSSAEPSRQAINQLMKQHSRGGSGGAGNLPVNLRDLSRAGTPNSLQSQKSQHRSATSVDSRSGSTRRVSTEKSSASQSRPSTPVRPNTSSIERSDSASKSLFQKGGLLRRKGSKLNMAVSTSSAASVVSPSRPSSSRAGLRGKDTTTSPTRDDARRPSISNPFDFTHVMHGDLNTFTGLGRIDESDLASQFDAIQARYRNTTNIRESLAHEPETLTPTEKAVSIHSVTALPQVPADNSNISPPAPPPKDSPPMPTPTPTDVRMSRSTENFSRPTPRSPVTSSTSTSSRPASCHLQHLAQVQTDGTDPEPTVIKPLPQLPTVIHAVSTQDDTARLMISAPLPPPPATFDKGLTRHHRQTSSRSSLRHMSTFPSSRHPQHHIQTHDGPLLAVKEEDGLARPHSDYELAQSAYRRLPERASRSGTKPPQVEDWEVAIDSAWDVEDDSELADEDGQSTRPASAMSKNRQSYLTIEQPPPENTSLPSTPLTMASPKSLRSPVGDKTNQSKRSTSSLVGLGIDTESGTASYSRVSRPPTLEVVTSDTGRVNVSPRLARSAYSAISHSSSQESIILSIASSIMSTQRSSISSVSVSEYAHSIKPDRTSVATSAPSPLLASNVQKAARPESTCLPSALLQEMNPKAQKAARPDSTCLPSQPASKRSSVVSTKNRPDSLYLSQDMLATFPVPENKTRRRSSAHPKTSNSETERKEDSISELPSVDLHARTASAARGSVSTRASVESNDAVPAIRQRSNTQNSRIRPARVSYSLFPPAGPPGHASSNIDIDGVAS